MAVQSQPSLRALRAAGVEWDRGNREKCQKHGVSLADIETALQGPLSIHPDHAHSELEERFKAIGVQNHRGLLIVFTLRKRAGQTFIRPISARYMHRREVDYYEEETANAENRRRS